MRLTFVIPTLSSGGAERVLSILVQGFLDKGYEISVITLSSRDKDFYVLPDGIKRLALNIMSNSTNPIQAIYHNLSRIFVLRKALKLTQPDVVISFLTATNILTILASSFTDYPVIGTVHNDLRMRSNGFLWDTLQRLVYPYGTKILSVSKGVNDYFTWLPDHKKVVIYNPFLAIAKNQELPTLPKGVDPQKLWLTSMGRLTDQKGFDLLLQAFAKIALNHPDWQLLILGDGELREELEDQKEQLGLTNQVFFLGRVSNPFAILQKSQLFVMSSRFEGFPMAHGEAMTCGLPVIATDCPSGPSELIRNGIDGILVPPDDPEKLAKVMDDLMSDEVKRQQLAQNTGAIFERFGLATVMKDWENLIREIIPETSK
jgi:GalNAc-alpha-(1->4)-GalNAc-alpha-(1->3)-diNAcBac-PP-undecaprenol alpha-1,4-N-acetyl-D-galactosaminyltransferase